MSGIQKRHANTQANEVPMEVLEKIIKMSEINLFNFTDFIKMFGQEQKKGILRKRVLSPAETASFSLKPMDGSLLRLSDAALVKDSIEIFHLILTYITRNRPADTSKDMKFYEVPKRMLHFGLSH